MSKSAAVVWIVASIVLLLVTGCGPRQPGPISVSLHFQGPDPQDRETVYSGEIMSLDVIVTNQGLDVYVDTVTSYVEILFGDSAGQAWDFPIDYWVNRVIPARGNDVPTAFGDGWAWEVKQATRVRFRATVFSNGGVAGDQVDISILPAPRCCEATSQANWPPYQASLREKARTCAAACNEGS